MKAYLITMLVLQLVALGTTSRTRDPYTDGELGAIAIGNMGLVIWIIYLLNTQL